MLPSASDKGKLFAKNVCKNSNLADSGVSLLVFPSRTYLKLCNIYVTPKMIKKVISGLDSSKVSDPNCIPVVVLKSCEPELSYILAELLLNMCLKESCFLDCMKVLLVVPVFKNVVERSTLINYYPVSLLSVVSKVFEKLVNNDCGSTRKIWPISDLQHDFMSSQSTVDLLTVISDRIARAFNRSGATSALALDIYNAFEKV